MGRFGRKFHREKTGTSRTVVKMLRAQALARQAERERISNEEAEKAISSPSLEDSESTEE